MDRRLPENIESAPQILDGSHLSEHALEVYSLGKISSEEILATVEEHLLVCAYCENRLDSFDKFHAAAKTALEAESSKPKQRKPGPLWLIVFAASVAAIFVIPPALKQNDAAVAVDLASIRNAPAVTAPSNRRLDLTVDLTGLTAPSYKWEIFNSNGQLKASGSIEKTSNKFSVEGLDPAQYWVRLTLAGSAQVEREFSLLVR